MKTRVDDRLRSEAQRFELRFGCEDCAHFDVPAAACANGYPSAPHRGVELRVLRELEFCKEFELV